MKPTIGRIVLYRVGQGDDHELKNNDAKVLPAMIVRVWGDTCVNLKVFADGYRDIWKTSVTQGDGEYQWSWPERT